jgi:transcriptional regulator with XRE-family HTH domain
VTNPSPEGNPRLILGLKLRRLRHAAGSTLRQLAESSGVSVSYLSEIEKGRKYPQPEKMMALAEALAVPFDELVSLQVTEDLSPLKQALASPLLREFPFALFGLEAGDVFELVNSDPTRAGALIHALLEVGQSYDVGIDAFLLAALRAYQQMNSNYFPDLEDAASIFRLENGWPVGSPASAADIASTLERDFGYAIDYTRLAGYPDLHDLRSVFQPGHPPRLLVNGDLMPSQQAFVLARELGYRVLDLDVRSLTSSWLRVESFDQVLNNFRASYFAGALLLDRATVETDMQELFAASTWQPELLAQAMARFEATPETYFTRMTQLVPHQFGLEEMFFLRLSTQPGGVVHLTKMLNTSDLPLAAGLGLGEHHCRRWPSLRLLSAPKRPPGLALAAQRSRFLTADSEFLVVSSARALALDQSQRSSVTVGWRLDHRFERAARFARDPAIPEVDVDLTCERCPLSDDLCGDRVAQPRVVAATRGREAKERALASLNAESGPDPAPAKA